MPDRPQRLNRFGTRVIVRRIPAGISTRRTYQTMPVLVIDHQHTFSAKSVEQLTMVVARRMVLSVS